MTNVVDKQIGAESIMIVLAAGNSNQFTDASASMVMSESAAGNRGLRPRVDAFIGCRNGHRSVLRGAQACTRPNTDINMPGLGEAFAVQVVHCRDRLGIPNDELNVNGGAIALGHRHGMSGSRLVGHAQTTRRQVPGVVTMCVDGGMSAAGLFEVP